MPEFDAAGILNRLAALRELDAPTHGGRVLSYVYDTGLGSLDELAADAIRLVQPVNGLDPTTFGSVAALEREVLGFARELFRGGDDVVGSVTSGGTESCLLAVKTARDVWRAAGGEGRARLVAPVTVHAAFQKAASYFDLELELVPVYADGSVPASRFIGRFGDDVAIVVVSAPNYPYGTLDPVAEIAAAASARGIAVHVDACIGGFVLPWVDGVAEWDFRVPGVTSLSADLHKFGYAPKGASVLLQRGRDRQRSQFFATTRWPGYPVVNPSLLGSKSAGPLAAAWAVIEALGREGFTELTASSMASTRALIGVVDAIEGLRVVGDPVGPLFAVATDESVAADRRVDPHHWADEVRTHGFVLQQQPGFTQVDGSHLPRTTHLTITPVTASVLGELSTALVTAADAVRGHEPAAMPPALAAQLGAAAASPLDSAAAAGLLAQLGIGAGGLPDRMAPVMALIEALPASVAERLLVELLGRLSEPG